MNRVEMFIEYGIGHRSGEVDIIGTNETKIYSALIHNPGTPVARVVSVNSIGKWKELDIVNGLCYANPIYNKSASNSINGEFNV